MKDATSHACAAAAALAVLTLGAPVSAAGPGVRAVAPGACPACRFVDASDYADRKGLSLVPEADRLLPAGRDLYARTLLLAPDARDAWLAMRAAARGDGIELQAVSGYRSKAYQAGIVLRKLARGQSLAQVLAVNAPPGYSEHHSGNAIDIGMAGEPALEESFERTRAFAWLTRHAGRFGFHMSYPRGNSAGFQYEPWHWCWSGAPAGALAARSVVVPPLAPALGVPIAGQDEPR